MPLHHSSVHPRFAMSAAPPREESFPSKLHRYLFFGWLLRAPEGDVYSRHAQVRHNRERLRRWLPHYLRVHTTLALAAALTLWGFDGPESSRCATLACAFALGAEACLSLALLCAWLALKLQSRFGGDTWR